MTDDLVKRLRKLAAWSVLPAYASYGEAADEIERLRAELAALRENSLAILTRVRGYRDKVITERDALRAQLAEAREALEEAVSYMEFSEAREKAARRARAVLDKIKGGGDE